MPNYRMHRSRRTRLRSCHNGRRAGPVMHVFGGFNGPSLQLRKAPMANGRGSLECCYCRHWAAASGWQGYDSAYEDGTCRFHQVQIPATLPDWTHRVCTDFVPGDEFALQNGVGQPWQDRSIDEITATRFSWLGDGLENNVLYGFSYSDPSRPWILMRLPPVTTNPDR
jgi:hypothetical protein